MHTPGAGLLLGDGPGRRSAALHLAPLREFGQAVFPRGSYLAGRFRDFRDPGRLAGKGWLKLEFDRIILPDAEVPAATKVISVQGFQVDGRGRILGRGHPKRDAIGWLLPPLWPVKVITLPMRGPRAKSGLYWSGFSMPSASNVSR